MKSEFRNPKKTPPDARPLRISSFGLLSSFDIRISSFSYSHPRLFLVHDGGDHPAHGTFIVANGFARGQAVGRNNHLLVHSRAVRVNGHHRRTFGFARRAHWLANDEPPALITRLLAGRHHIAF